jgi:hypothetical protein
LSSDLDLRRGVAALVIALTCIVVGGCTGGTSAPTATAETRTYARIEAARLCAVTGQTYRTEAGIDADLTERLAERGLDRAGWKRWHDSLADSPARAAQLAAASAGGCP